MVEAPSAEVMKALLRTSTYDPSIVPQLEAYVKAEAENAPYNAMANRTLMKFLHQFFPTNEEFRQDVKGVTALVLFLALVNNYEDGVNTTSNKAGMNDFFALTCIIPESAQSEEPCATIIHCYELLENCQFPEFWNTYLKELVPLVPRSLPSKSLNLLSTLISSAETQDRFRRIILCLLAVSYRDTSLSNTVLPFLKLKDESEWNAFHNRNRAIVDEIVSHVSAASDIVSFVPTSDNTKRSRAYKEEVHLESIANLMAKAIE